MLSALIYRSTPDFFPAGHDELVAAAHRAQADALEIEARARRRLADEHGAAQERDEIFGAHDGARKRVEGSNAMATARDLGLGRGFDGHTTLGATLSLSGAGLGGNSSRNHRSGRGRATGLALGG